jgi:hypothetical protein
LSDRALRNAHPDPLGEPVLVLLQDLDLVPDLAEVDGHAPEDLLADVVEGRATAGLVVVRDEPSGRPPAPHALAERLAGLAVHLGGVVEAFHRVQATADDRGGVPLETAVRVAEHRHKRLREVAAAEGPGLDVPVVARRPALQDDGGDRERDAVFRRVELLVEGRPLGRRGRLLLDLDDLGSLLVLDGRGGRDEREQLAPVVGPAGEPLGTERSAGAGHRVSCHRTGPYWSSRRART